MFCDIVPSMIRPSNALCPQCRPAAAELLDHIRQSRQSCGSYRPEQIDSGNSSPQFFYSYSDAHTPTLEAGRDTGVGAGSIITLRGTGWTSIPGNDGTISVTASGEPVSCGAVVTLSNYSNNSNASLDAVNCTVPRLPSGVQQLRVIVVWVGLSVVEDWENRDIKYLRKIVSTTPSTGSSLAEHGWSFMAMAFLRSSGNRSPKETPFWAVVLENQPIAALL